MGDRNQFEFVKAHRARFEAPLLEVGAHDYGSTQDLRVLFPGASYLGVDRQAGPGVDRVVDLAAPFEEVDRALEGRRFGGVFCLSVLEHCEQPFRMADHLTRLLQPGGSLYVSVPFAWKFHGYPSDYWRFTHEGVRLLFPGLRFDTDAGRASSARAGTLRPLDEGIGRVRVWRPLRRLFGFRYALAPTMVHMIGSRAHGA
jgi:SAM-dependent methyltransferase